MFCIDKDKLYTREKNLSIIIFMLVAFSIFIVYCVVDNVESLAYNKLRVLGLMGWGALISFFIFYRHITSVYITPTTILVLSMFSFCYGQILLFGLGVDYDYFFTNSYYASFYSNDFKILLSSNFYTLMCLCVFCLGILISISPKRTSTEKNIFFCKSMKKTFLALFFISGIPYFIYNVYLASYSLSYGYSQSLEITQPAIIRYVGVFFVPSAIGAIISCKRDKALKTFLAFFTAVNCVCAFIIGGRSFAVGLIIGVAIVLFIDKRVSGKVILLLCIGAFILGTISVSIADYRSAVNDSSFISIIIYNLFQKNVLIRFLGEAGFSGTSIVWTMKLVKSGQETFGGMTYIGAVAGLIPSTLDFFDIFRYFEQYTQLEGLLTERFSLGYGVGFSLIAESYLNFKWFGVIPMFFEAIILGKLLNLDRTADPWKRYVAVTMMSVLLSIPRRDIVFLSNQFTLCVIFPYIFIRIVMAFSVPKTSYIYGCKEK